MRVGFFFLVSNWIFCIKFGSFADTFGLEFRFSIVNIMQCVLILGGALKQCDLAVNMDKD